MEDKTTTVKHAYGRLQQVVTSSGYAGNSTFCGAWTGPNPTLARAAKLVGLLGSDQRDAQKVKAKAKALCKITHPDKYVATNAADGVMAAAVFQCALACLNVATFFSQEPESHRSAEGRETQTTLRL